MTPQGVSIKRGKAIAWQFKAFSSEVDAGSRQENAPKQKIWSLVPILSERKRL